MSKATRAPTFLNPDEDGIMWQSGMGSYPFPFVNKAGRRFNGLSLLPARKGRRLNALCPVEPVDFVTL
jgi:hypothetical protein